MKFFNWVHNKINGGQASRTPIAVPSTHQKNKEPAKEEFNDWPQGLLAIGTFGNTELTENQENNVVHVQDDEIVPAEQCWSPDLSEFTTEEVGKLQKELTKLLNRKPKAEEPINDLPLDRFLNCPSSLEVDRIVSNRYSISTISDEKDEEEIDRTIRIILGRCKDVCEKKKKAIHKKSLTFLLKKMFACQSGFAPTPGLRDPFPESRMEKLLRTMLAKRMCPQTSRASSMKKYLTDSRQTSNSDNQDEDQEKRGKGSKWDKTDSEYLKWIAAGSNSLSKDIIE